MKRYIAIILILIFMVSSHDLWAGTTTLTTYYPPPAAAYNKLQMATNVNSGNNSTSEVSTLIAPNSFCNNSSAGNPGANGMIFLYQGDNTLYQCPNTWSGPYSAGNPVPTFCNGSNNGVILADPSGTFHICMGGKDTLYPQECYNIFCSNTNMPPGSATCPNQPTCPAGFSATAINNGTFFDSFQIDLNTTIYSYVCCSGVHS